MFKTIALIAVLCSSLSASASAFNMPTFSNKDFDNAGNGGAAIRRGVDNTVKVVRQLGSKVVKVVKVGVQTVVVTLATGAELVLNTAENGVEGVIYHGNRIYTIVSSDVMDAADAVQGTAVYNAGKKTVTFVVAGGKKVVCDFSKAGKEVLEALAQL